MKTKALPPPKLETNTAAMTEDLRKILRELDAADVRRREQWEEIRQLKAESRKLLQQLDPTTA